MHLEHLGYPRSHQNHMGSADNFVLQGKLAKYDFISMMSSINSIKFFVRIKYLCCRLGSSSHECF